MMSELEVSETVAFDHGLSADEYRWIIEKLGRIPTFTELGMYSVMWSEHCSYKNSIAELKKLPRSGGRLLVAAGEENAGLVDIGDGQAIAFKIESHNHPSAVEPYQGAATGVGGILRDIFTMGARPIAALNSLRFGDLSRARTRALLRGIVKGIGDYGNSFGVPTVAGDIFFDPCYNENPLVNAMAVGLVEHGKVAHAVSRGVGNSVLIVGSATGRDGIHGATFASEELSEESEARRPSVQVGDPFTEKLLLEATLEAIATGYVVGIQDMGAAGITCSTSEMSAKGKSGMEVDIDKVPVREEGMSPYEILLSESQERMLLVVRPEHEQAVGSIFSKWDLHCTRIGIVTSDGMLRIRDRGRIVAEVPAESLVLGGGAPVYIRDRKPPVPWQRTDSEILSSLPVPDDLGGVLLRLLASPNIASRIWVTTQYDSTVRTNTVDSPGDAAVVRIKGTSKAIALKTDCNPRYVFLDPYKGAQIAVAESARNVVCVGARPLAITNCLNFGNPYKPEIYWQFAEAIRGIGDACRALGTPVTGGNVSFYNENSDSPVYPTPAIGMLGLLDNAEGRISADFKQAGDEIYLLGAPKGSIGGSEYLYLEHGILDGEVPLLDLVEEMNVQKACLQMAESGILSSAHDISEGGIAVTLAECCILSRTNKLGAIVKLPASGRADAVLFGEDQSCIVISLRPMLAGKAKEIAASTGTTLTRIGRVGGDGLTIEGFMRLSCKEMAHAYEVSLGEKVGFGWE